MSCTPMHISLFSKVKKPAKLMLWQPSWHNSPSKQDSGNGGIKPRMQFWDKETSHKRHFNATPSEKPYLSSERWHPRIPHVPLGKDRWESQGPHISQCEISNGISSSKKIQVPQWYPLRLYCWPTSFTQKKLKMSQWLTIQMLLFRLE